MKQTADELKNALVDNLMEPEIIQGLKALKEIFVHNRDKIEDYTKDPRLIAAYGMVYMPTNAPKLRFLLDQIGPEAIEKIRNSRFVDFGTGTGTYLLAFLEWAGEIGSVAKHIGVDRSDGMLKQARAFTRTFYPDAHCEFMSSMPPKATTSSTVCFGNVVNEMSSKSATALVSELDPETVIFIEPGTTEVFPKMLQVRSAMEKLGYTVLYPCPNFSACPVAKREGDWCHQVLKTIHHQSVERLCQIAQLDRRTLPFIGHVYQKNAVEYKRAHYMRYISESKHAFIWQVCLEVEGENRLIQFEFVKKLMSKDERKDFKRRSVGESFDYEILKEVREDYWRVKLK